MGMDPAYDLYLDDLEFKKKHGVSSFDVRFLCSNCGRDTSIRWPQGKKVSKTMTDFWPDECWYCKCKDTLSPVLPIKNESGTTIGQCDLEEN